MCSATTLVRPMALITSFATIIFLPVPSISLNLQFGNIIAKGIPGKPPPVPKSIIVVPSLKFIAFAMAKEWSTWCEYRLEMSFLDITFIFWFQSSYKACRALNCSICLSVRCGKYSKISFILYL